MIVFKYKFFGITSGRGRLTTFGSENRIKGLIGVSTWWMGSTSAFGYTSRVWSVWNKFWGDWSKRAFQRTLCGPFKLNRSWATPIEGQVALPNRLPTHIVISSRDIRKWSEQPLGLLLTYNTLALIFFSIILRYFTKEKSFHHYIDLVCIQLPILAESTEKCLSKNICWNCSSKRRK